MPSGEWRLRVIQFSHRLITIAVLGMSLPVFCVGQRKTNSLETPGPSFEATEPATDALDLTMYGRIREEGLLHTHVMEYVSALSDGIGPRLTGSPNMAKANAWTRDQLTALGCQNAHLEDWGEFGVGWQQLNTWVRMTSPTLQFL
jgi:carboxypeptidase Q